MVRNVVICMMLCLVAGGCKSSDTPAPANPGHTASETTAPAASPAAQQSASAPTPVVASAKPKLDACALLTADEIKTIQGEAATDTKLSGQSSGGFSLSQCFFTLPTFENSISLMVAHRGEGNDAREPKDFWRSNFHDKPRRREPEKKAEEEKEESGPPEKVSGLGDEAFWLGNRVTGALYVLKGNSYMRISIGGPADKAGRKRSRMLAEKAVARL